MIGTARKSTEGAHASLNPPLSRVMIRGHLKTNALQKGNVGPDSEYETRPLSTLIDSSKRHQAINRHLQSEDSNFSIQRRRAGKKGVRILRGGVVVCLLARGRVEGRGESVAGLVVWDHIPLRKCPSKKAITNQGVSIHQGTNSRPEENVALFGCVPADTHNVHRRDPRRFIREGTVLPTSKVELTSLL